MFFFYFLFSVEIANRIGYAYIPIVFLGDKPFMFIMYNKSTNTVIMIGNVKKLD